MAATGTSRRAANEPFPWFSLVLIAVAALAVISTSAVRVLRITAAESAREQQWHIAHEALLRASAEIVHGAIEPPPNPEPDATIIPTTARSGDAS